MTDDGNLVVSNLNFITISAFSLAGENILLIIEFQMIQIPS